MIKKTINKNKNNNTNRNNTNRIKKINKTNKTNKTNKITKTNKTNRSNGKDQEFSIKRISAREVLDSRGNPTLEVEVELKNGIKSKGIVPSGASTGKHEAIELRDHQKRYDGMGVKKAIENVKKVSKLLKNWDCREQEAIDELMKEIDGTKNKAKLGANTILGISIAVSRAAAKAENKEYYQYLSKLFEKEVRQRIKNEKEDSKKKNLVRELEEIKKKKHLLPIPFSNIINGGKHAPGKLKFQEFMIAPTRAKNFSEATRIIAETYHELKRIIMRKYGVTGVGDEGGFAPPLETPEEALNLIRKAIKNKGYEEKIRIALDPASSEFYDEKKKLYDLGFKKIKAKTLAEYYLKLIRKYPIISLEDGFAEDDFESWNYFKELIDKLPKKERVQIVGDDLLVTNPERIAYAIRENLCNALLLKVNQIGTITEAISAAVQAKSAGWNVMVSHRSGETEDTLIADLSVAIRAGQIKIGAPCRGERTAKYNRLLRIEEEVGDKGKYNKI